MPPQKQADKKVRELIRKRWSPRAFKDKPVEPEKLKKLFEAARQAPSSYNEQPWRFIVAAKDDNPVEYRLLFDCLNEGNQKWAKYAPVLMLSVAKMHFEHNGKPNRHAFHDVGLAVGNLILQATSLDLYVHQMAGFDPRKAKELLHIPDGFEPLAMIALGYRGDPGKLPDKLQQRELEPSERKDLKEIVFSGSWGNSFAE